MDRPDEAAVKLDRFIPVRQGDFAQRQRGADAVVARADEEIEPVEVEPSVAVQQQEVVLEARQSVDQSPARAKWHRLDRQFELAGEPPSDVTFGEESDHRLAEMSGEQEEVVKATPPRLAEQGFEERRPADVEQGLGRGLCPVAEPGPQPADEDRALIAQTLCLRWRIWPTQRHGRGT